MNYIDIIIGIVLLAAAVRGFRKGLIHEVATLVAIVLGIWGALHFSDLTADWLRNTFGWDFKLLNWVAYLVTFLIIVVLIYYFGKLIDSIVKAAKLSFINKILGLLFSLLKSALIISALLFVYEGFDPEGRIIAPETREESYIYTPLRNFAPAVLPFIKERALKLERLPEPAPEPYDSDKPMQII
ncbi:MAG: CvpA family protein [Bacteroidales bacterium]|nr:CvpA family protein [Bacteroidales bacterium]